jgi:hypothetical protein
LHAGLTVGGPGYVALALPAARGNQKLHRLRMSRRVARVARRKRHGWERPFGGFSRHFRRHETVNYAG